MGFFDKLKEKILKRDVLQSELIERFNTQNPSLEEMQERLFGTTDERNQFGFVGTKIIRESANQGIEPIVGTITKVTRDFIGIEYEGRSSEVEFLPLDQVKNDQHFHIYTPEKYEKLCSNTKSLDEILKESQERASRMSHQPLKTKEVTYEPDF